MLLTSGQISMTISSCVVFIFTSLLFLSGYILQQQTVRSIQLTIHPPARPAVPETPSIAITFGNPSELDEQLVLAANSDATEWKKLAYVQLVREQDQVCDAVTLFAELHRQASLAQRVLLYPRAWETAAHEESEQLAAAASEKNLRLLRKTAERHSTLLMPIDPLLDGEADLELAYPLAGLLSLDAYARVIYLQPSGLAIDARQLDRFFSTEMNSTIATASAPFSTAPLLLAKPSTESFDQAMDLILNDPPSRSTLRGFTERLPVDVDRLVVQASSLGTGASEPARAFPDGVAYVYLDEKMPSAAMDVASDGLSQAGPVDHEARESWEHVYASYQAQRKETCELDLEDVDA